jgi:hypothetical protein
MHNNKKKKFGKCGPCPVFASYTLTFALQLRKNHGKTSLRKKHGTASLRKKHRKSSWKKHGETSGKSTETPLKNTEKPN